MWALELLFKDMFLAIHIAGAYPSLVIRQAGLSYYSTEMTIF